MRKSLFPLLLFSLFGLMLIFAASQKDKLNDYLSEQIQKQLPGSTPRKEILDEILSNTTGNRYIILEFGSTGCSACRRMEKVLEDIKQKHTAKVEVKFYNVLDFNAQPRLKYFGVSSIPMQLILNPKGEIVFKHYGYISGNELSNQINELPNF